MKILKFLILSLVIFLLFFAGAFLYFKDYLEKGAGTDIYYMFEFQADEVIKNSKFPILGAMFKNVVKPLYPIIYGWDMFVVPRSFEDSIKVYDMTEYPAIFRVVGLAPENSAYLTFNIVQPTDLLGTRMDAKIDCLVNQTKIANYQDKDKTARLLIEIDKNEKVESDITNLEPYHEDVPVYDYVKSFISSTEFLNGQSNMTITAKCKDAECNSIGPSCIIKVLGKELN